MTTKIPGTEACYEICTDDRTTDLFEGQYPIPNGVTYNSYVILDEKIAVLDTVDPCATDSWMRELVLLLDGKAPDYLIISHMEPDHAGSIREFLAHYPNVTLVGTAKAFPMLKNFCEDLPAVTQISVKDGDTLSLGTHTLQFITAPMVHWPEVMVTYETTNQLLFAADAFGKFGTSDIVEDWIPEARRYYVNIVGKYGAQVQALLKKAAALDIRTICPLHGPVLTGDLTPYLTAYQNWSTYTPEEHAVLICFATLHGNTAVAAHYLASALEALGESVTVMDLARCDLAEATAQAFRCDRLVLCAATLDGGLATPMAEYLLHLQAKSVQNRTVTLVENGSWAPVAAKQMQKSLESMKNITIAPETVTLKSVMHTDDKAALDSLAAAIHAQREGL